MEADAGRVSGLLLITADSGEREPQRNHHYLSPWPATIAATEHVVSRQHPESPRVTSSRRSSPPRSVGDCDSPAATGASISARTLNCG
ncbi:hypothetical protein EYF80_060103 [Liparis tanakae]|uniref:Uncharacterized protein n=1 Tax=Liparis tanakae TaxID=230148 RepID=A0A4Z2ELX2_9TELE|nr:hypothetical protein EYF80_060103 [Liparis tanakae]